ncbi:hypothetical protein ACFL6I_25935, partial [candidate division KSB1 bacterium]
MEKLDLSGIKLPSHFEDNLVLDKQYSVDELAELLCQEWILPLECEKCGRSDYCKFAGYDIIGGKNEFKGIENYYVQCGIIATIIQNYIDSIFSYLFEFSNEELQKFFEAAFILFDYLYYSEMYNGLLVNKNYLKFYLSDSPRIFSFPFIFIPFSKRIIFNQSISE